MSDPKTTEKEIAELLKDWGRSLTDHALSHLSVGDFRLLGDALTRYVESKIDHAETPF